VAGAGTTTTNNGTATGGTQATVPAQTRTSDRVSLSAAWELDVWGRIRRQVESQKASAVASESELANALLSAQAMLAQSYLQLRATDMDLDLYEHSIVSYERALTIARTNALPDVPETPTIVPAALLERRPDIAAAERRTAAEAAEKTVEITQNQYQAGTVDYLNVVTAQQTALTAERAVRDLANRRLTASVGLLKALGGGWKTSDLVH
jgi:outer membrane protein TolC